MVSFRTSFGFFEREQAGLVLPFQVGFRKYSLLPQKNRPLTFKFRKSVDGSVGVKTPAGTAGQVRPRRSVSIDAAHRPPAESEAPGMEINISILNLTRVCLQSETL
ncbi:hypothetical protein P4525_17120, partial [Peribacillus psychrosaccharolyticus]|uniref:hypothetical protein n=1 Tax=Peribacillus psychrosaccharolyticus TaxID=1407 RepID=UPI002E250EFA|nr:hypothetical protein [Peribacillus psychrosaccharolyticus]